MIRFAAVLLCGVFYAVAVNAQPVIDIGQDPLKDLNPKKEDSKVIEEAKEGRGIFSFMKFSFGKKEDTSVRLEEGETVESRLVKEAEAGSVDSQLLLGYIYLYGDKDIPQDYKKAFHYYSLAAEQDDKIAVNNLGSLYYSGIGTERSTVKAAQMFEKAVSLGNNEAAVNLAFIYLTGMGLPKNYSRAVSLFEIAANDANPTAQFMLGYAYYKGFGVKRDLRKAFSLMREAAGRNYDDAQYILANMYINGEGVAKNYGNAVKFLSAAANQGNLEAMTELGDILVNGVVYTQNIYEAHVWFNIASVSGAPKAAQKRDALEKALKIEELLQAQSQAERFVEKPSEVTIYIRETFGDNIRGYIDEAISDIRKKRGV
ncbi:MAG: sel1 repeat family protein [Lactobacillaceae bacterium]|jgi:TPR repeat protein|nr:sel1 repeat family protein [Lactobacillaceae bacterium]